FSQPGFQRGPLHAWQPHVFSHSAQGRPHHSFQGPRNSVKRSFHEAGMGPSTSQPSLHQLRQDNFKKARRHFQDAASTPGPTPRIAPRAPDNRHGFLLNAPGSMALASGSHGGLQTFTPSSLPGGDLWKNSYGTLADKEAVQLGVSSGVDLLGSFYDDAGADVFDDVSGDSDLEAGDAQHPVQVEHGADDESTFPPAAKRKLAAQQAYISELEDQQLTLRERIFLLEQQLGEARRHQTPEALASGHSSDAEDASDEAERAEDERAA
ncbi:hypothetical protein TSOC_006747, partial [Tetrabaena socialis]